MTVLHQGSRCPLHYCGVYKGLINHIITPHRIIPPSLLQTVKAGRKVFEEKDKAIPRLSSQLNVVFDWRVFYKKT